MDSGTVEGFVSDIADIKRDLSEAPAENTALEILQIEQDMVDLLELSVRVLDYRFDQVISDLPQDSTCVEIYDALNTGNSLLNALYNELEVV